MCVLGGLLASVVSDVARRGIDLGEEGADALPVRLARSMGCPTRPESITPVRPAEPVVCTAAVPGPSNSKPLTKDVEDEQHRSRHALGAAVHARDDERGAPVTV